MDTNKKIDVKSQDKIKEVTHTNIGNSKGKLLSWSEMLQVPKEPDWLIKELIEKGSIVVVYGGGGSKKTYSIIDMSMCYMMRKEWLGFSIVENGSVLFIDEESGKDRLGRRYIEAKNGYNVKTELPIYTLTMSRYVFRNPNDCQEIEKYIKKTKAKLVIIDSLITVLVADENSSEKMVQLFGNLRAVANRTKSVIVLIHHSNKINGYRGSSVIRDQCDILIHVTSKIDSPNIDFETEKTRDIASTKWAAISHLEKGKKFYLLSSKNGRAKKLGKAQEHVLSYLLEYNHARMEDFKSNHGQCSPSAIRNSVYKLLEDGYISNDEWQGKSRLFTMTELGKEYADNNLYSNLENFISSL